jgi:acyl-CoA synthetase (AMP-forming)/AMP-acid ligase II
MNIVEPVLFQCKVNPHAQAICIPGSAVDHVNYGTLATAMANVARSALSRGLKPRDVVMLSVRETIFHAILTLALMRLGMVPIAGRLDSMPSGLRIDAVVTDRPERFAGQSNVVTFDQSWTLGEDTPFDYDSVHQTELDDLCTIVLTSGSTGVAKAVGYTHGNLAKRTSSYLYSKGPRFLNGTRLFCDLGIGTSPGFRYLILMLWRGGTIYYLGADPTAILQLLDLHRIDVMSTSPYGLSQFVQYFERDSAYDCNFQSIVTQGAMLTKELSERVRRRMCPNLYCTYGATEVGTVAMGPAAVLAATPGAVGFVEPGVSLQVLDASGNVLAPGREGRVRVKTPSMVSGYVGDVEKSSGAFIDGFFDTGDLGYVDTSGMLVISGREKSVLNLGSFSIKPEIIEDVVTSFQGIDEAAVAGIPNELGVEEPWALIMAKGPVDEDALRRHCEGKLNDVAVPKRFIAVDAIPRSGQGKIERHRLAELCRRHARGA